MKHAFHGRACGVLRIELRSRGSDIFLSVSDDGKGLPAGLSVADSQTLGMQLVSMLVEQLKGRMEIESSRGTRFSVVFPADTA